MKKVVDENGRAYLEMDRRTYDVLRIFVLMALVALSLYLFFLYRVSRQLDDLNTSLDKSLMEMTRTQVPDTLLRSGLLGNPGTSYAGNVGKIHPAEVSIVNIPVLSKPDISLPAPSSWKEWLFFILCALIGLLLLFFSR